MIPFNGETKITGAAMVRRKQSASVMEGYTKHHLSLSFRFLYTSLSLLYTVTDTGLPEDPEENDSVWRSVARASYPSTATHRGIRCRQSSSCLPVSYITITDMSTADCMQGVMSPPASRTHHTFKK